MTLIGRLITLAGFALVALGLYGGISKLAGFYANTLEDPLAESTPATGDPAEEPNANLPRETLGALAPAAPGVILMALGTALTIAGKTRARHRAQRRITGH